MDEDMGVESANPMWVIKVVASTPEKRVYSTSQDETYEGIEGEFETLICVPTAFYKDSGEAEDFVKQNFEDYFTPLDDDNGEPSWTDITCFEADPGTEFFPES